MRRAALLLAVIPWLLACGGDSQEAMLEEATEVVEEARERVGEARAQVADRQAVVDEATQELGGAQAELREAEAGLRVAEAGLRKAASAVNLTATDATLFRAVQRALLDDDALENVAIRAEVRQGVVTLHGEVHDAETLARALEVARETPGVIRVENATQAPPVASVPPED